ncbi:MAG: glycerophosphodiester phosphodiesterase [Pseudomonadales bacterium]|nr:glycerophosphodiester phosphodiesterase [Pseudomonadales bacterium]
MRGAGMAYLAALLALTPMAATASAGCPLVIAHRGASGDRPEHTLAAYELAIRDGADFIEPDLVPTRDGVLISRHENALAVVRLDEAGAIVHKDGQPDVVEATTNVADHPEFADRLVVKTIDGRPIGGWFSEDFTLKEIRTLRARERMPTIRPHNVRYDDQFAIPTFTDVLKLAKRKGVGVYPEIKHYTWFAREAVLADGKPFRVDPVQLLVDSLLRQKVKPEDVFVQSFEVEPLLRLRALAERGETPRWPLVQLTGGRNDKPYDLKARKADGSLAQVASLFSRFGVLPHAMTYGELLDAPGALAASHADGVGPPYALLLNEPALVASLHTGGLKLHPYTLRAESVFLGAFRDFGELAKAVTQSGVDGFFTDHAWMARRTLRGHTGAASTTPCR